MKLEELQNIDFSDVGNWPTPLRIAAIALLCVAVLGLGIWFDTRQQWSTLERARAKEAELKQSFEQRQHKAANLSAYQSQMRDMQRSFGEMLRKLPSETEVAELLVDISQSGLANGLQFELFRPENEVPQDFYAELPIKIRVAGDYHEFGHFVSDVAALDRIVTLYDVTIKPKSTGKNDGKNGGLLVMDATAKTYRYLEGQEGG